MTVRVDPTNRSKIEEDFWDFHRAHPEVYTELVAIARRLRKQGWDRFSINTVFEVARYRSMVGGSDPSRPKLNNNHRALFARLIMRQERDLAGVFKTRKRTTSHHRVP